MRPAVWRLLAAAPIATGLAACACLCQGVHPVPVAAPPAPPAPATPAPTVLSENWMFGLERMTGDPEPVLPFTNRFLADLAAMPSTQLVFLGSDTNAYLFAAYPGRKLRVASWLHGEGNCMTVTYTVFVNGVIQGSFGLIVPALPAGTEPDTMCIDRAATAFYQALARQGF